MNWRALVPSASCPLQHSVAHLPWRRDIDPSQTWGGRGGALLPDTSHQREQGTAMNRGAGSIRAVLFACVCVVTIGGASASPLTYEITLTKPLLNGADSIGGPATPVVFKLTVDSDAPDGNPATTEGYYLGIESVLSVGSESVSANPPIFQIVYKPEPDVFPESTFNSFIGGDLSGTIGGRTLYLATFSIYTLSGPLVFSSDALPMDASFADRADAGYVSLIFDALPTGPEFDLWSGRVGYFAYISPADFNLKISVPEPATFALLGLGLVGIAASRRRRLR